MKKLRTIFAILVALSLIKIGVVTGEGGAKDKSFNQANVEAIQAWTKANGAKEPVVLETKTQSDITSNLQNAAKVSDIISLAGFEFEKEIPKVAEQYKDKKFMFVDTFVDAPNIASLIFKEQEAGYLAGFAAALQSKTGKVGFIGGTKTPPVERFGIGFVHGAKAAKSDIKVMYNYSGTFSDTNKGKTLAATMYDSGADVIFVAAGNTGNGVISEAKERGIIDMSKSGESAILTSAVKNIEVAVTKILNEIKEGKFTKGEHIFGIKENGVGIPKENPNLSEEAKTKIAKAIEELKSGKVEVAATGDELKAKGLGTNLEGEL